MRTLLLAFATQFIRAQLQSGIPELIEANSHENAEVQEKFLEDQELIISTGTYPCIFKVDDDFYDYTPFKLASADVYKKTGQ